LFCIVVVVVFWAVWHVPLWFLAGSSQQGSSFWPFLASLVLTSVLYTWLVNKAKGSILVAVVFHAMSNTASQMFPGSTSNLFYWLVLGLTVVLVVTVYGPRTLARKGRESLQVSGATTLGQESEGAR
jgi:membrane protease YdiL (CAAX protease family)